MPDRQYDIVAEKIRERILYKGKLRVKVRSYAAENCDKAT